MVPTILVAKGGSVFKTRDFGNANKVGEQGETEGLVRHLAAHWSGKVVYFGQWRGSHIDGVDVVESFVPGDLNEQSPAGYQQECFRQDEKALEPYAPFLCFLQTAGYAPTFSHIDNPNGAIVQAAAVRYSAPALNVMRHFKVPRVVINNDPRTYPRDQEMSLMGFGRPVALLDQCEGERPQVVGGKKYIRRSVYSACESWAYHIHRENQDLDPCVCVAHAHVDDGIRGSSWGPWHEVLGGGLPEGFHIYGKGWEKSPWISEGPCRPQEALDLFNMHTCGPVVSHTPGFRTGKPYVMVSQGCIPLLHKDYPWHAKAPRICEPGDLLKWSRVVASRKDEYRERFRVQCQPRWELLHDLLNDLLDGRTLSHTRYGGYLPC